MTTTRKVFLGIAGALAVVVLGWVLLIGSVYAWGGVITVKIQEDGGPNLFLPVPAALVSAAAMTGGLALDSDLFPAGHLEHQIEESFDIDFGEWGPAVRSMLEVIEDCPDVTFVDVEDRNTHVRVVKEGRYLRVIVNDSDLNLSISLPTKTATRTIAHLIS